MVSLPSWPPENVVSVAALDRVCAVAALDHIAAVVALQQVAAVAAVELVSPISEGARERAGAATLALLRRLAQRFAGRVAQAFQDRKRAGHRKGARRRVERLGRGHR